VILSKKTLPYLCDLELAKEQLAKQGPTTLEKEWGQAKRVEARISVNIKKTQTEVPPEQ